MMTNLPRKTGKPELAKAAERGGNSGARTRVMLPMRGLRLGMAGP